MKTTGLIEKSKLIGHIKADISAKEVAGQVVRQDVRDFLAQVEEHPNSQVYLELDDATRDITLLG